jgi:hypothetical protein
VTSNLFYVIHEQSKSAFRIKHCTFAGQSENDYDKEIFRVDRTISAFSEKGFQKAGEMENILPAVHK